MFQFQVVRQAPLPNQQPLYWCCRWDCYCSGITVASRWNERFSRIQDSSLPKLDRKSVKRAFFRVGRVPETKAARATNIPSGAEPDHGLVRRPACRYDRQEPGVRFHVFAQAAPDPARTTYMILSERLILPIIMRWQCYCTQVNQSGNKTEGFRTSLGELTIF